MAGSKTAVSAPSNTTVLKHISRILLRLLRITRRVLRLPIVQRSVATFAVALSLWIVFSTSSSGPRFQMSSLRSNGLQDLERQDTLPLHQPENGAVPDPAVMAVSSETAARRARAAAAAAARHHGNIAHSNATTPTGLLGNRFCILQPTLSVGNNVTWDQTAARQHIALRAFLRTFANTVKDSEKRHYHFAIYYGHDSDDPVFGDLKLRQSFEDEAHRILRSAHFADDGIDLIFTPLYGLHSRVNAIWNFMAKDAYYDGCDYFFMSNDDMVFFTSGWVTAAVQSLDGIGAPVSSKRPCRYLGIVRFKDEWANWATFTFHVSTRLHMDIFGGVYYPVPYNSAHNDYWIHFVYGGFNASKYRGEVKVRNRVEDVEYALAHPKDTKRVAPPRYQYDKRGDVNKYIYQGRWRLRDWLRQNKDSQLCLPPL